MGKAFLVCLTCAAIAFTGCSDRVQQAAPALIVKGMRIASGAKKGFFVTNGKPTYHDWNTSEGNITIPLADADVNSFASFDHPSKSVALFAKDKNCVYMAINYGPVVIDGALPDSFSLVSENGEYAKDKLRAYFIGTPIQGSDPATFVHLMHPFSRDANGAHIGPLTIPVQDLETWEPLSEGVCESLWSGNKPTRARKIFICGWSRDRVQFYRGTTPVSTVDRKSFVPLGHFYGKDDDGVYSFLDIDCCLIEGADPGSFRVLTEEQILACGYAYDAEDRNRKYRTGEPTDD